MKIPSPGPVGSSRSVRAWAKGWLGVELGKVRAGWDWFFECPFKKSSNRLVNVKLNTFK